MRPLSHSSKDIEWNVNDYRKWEKEHPPNNRGTKTPRGAIYT